MNEMLACLGPAPCEPEPPAPHAARMNAASAVALSARDRRIGPLLLWVPWDRRLAMRPARDTDRASRPAGSLVSPRPTCQRQARAGPTSGFALPTGGVVAIARCRDAGDAPWRAGSPDWPASAWV